MATATFLRTKSVSQTNEYKSEAIVDVDGQEVTVLFWFNLIDVMGKEDVRNFLCCEALKATGNLKDAHDLIAADAKGSIIEDPKAKPRFSDTRNWQKSWIDDNPLPAKVSAIDPLA